MPTDGRSLPALGTLTPWNADADAEAPASTGLLVPEPGMEPVPGYRLIKRLGQGGFGEVWQALGPGGFPVALKLIRLGAASGEVELRSLELMKQVRHANLLGLFGAWQCDTLLVVAMELAEGTLQDRLAGALAEGLPGIPAAELLEYMADAARGLDYLNAPRPGEGYPHGVLHRDVKPANLLLVGGCVKVGDFGLAKLLRQTLVSNTGSMSLAYAAPECFQGQMSAHVDQYSLAVTYCQLRCNRLPFRGTAEEMMLGHVMNPPELGGLAEAERAVVARALAKEPRARWPSCRAFVKGLREATANAPDTRVKAGRKVVVPPRSDAVSDTYVQPMRKAQCYPRIGRPPLTLLKLLFLFAITALTFHLSLQHESILTRFQGLLDHFFPAKQEQVPVLPPVRPVD
jgi:serine/threonine protein kinase